MFIALIEATYALTYEMSPYLLLGFIFAGLLHVFVPIHWVARHLSHGAFASVFKAVAIGVPLPLCSCSVIPAAVALKEKGANRGALLGFLISTPITGADSILATYALMGGVFTTMRLVAATATALVAGMLANIWVQPQLAAQAAQTPDPVMGSHHTSWGQKLGQSLRYAFVSVPKQLYKSLLLGLLLGGVISAWLPVSWVEPFMARPTLSLFAILLVAMPMYVCATGSIPIAASLMLKGLSPGAALVFLLAGPATNAVTISVVAKELGQKMVWLYMATIAMLSVGFGYLVNWLWQHLPIALANHGTHEHTNSLLPHWLSLGCTILFVLLLLNAIRQHVPSKS